VTSDKPSVTRHFLLKEAPKMNETDILDILQKEKRYLQENFGLLSIGLFGSYSKGKQGPDSDIDLLVELSEPRFDYLAGIQIYLEDRIGKRVEVIRKRKDISAHFLSQIEKSIHYV
jgi:predicted nucleotidyltransferase